MNIQISPFALFVRCGVGFMRACALLILPAILIACDDDDDRPDPSTAPNIGDALSRTFTAYEPASVHFSNSGGRATGCSVSPALPGGLRIGVDTNELLPSSCIIAGVPTDKLVETSYTVTAANGVGSDTATVSFAVNFPAPDLSDLNNQRLSVGVNALIEFDNAGGWVPASGDACLVSPSLPAGLSATGSPQGSCQITGTPAAVSEERTYELTATNPGGNDSALFSLTTSPVSLPAQDTVVWEDQFDGSTLNSENWDIQTGDGCPQNCGWGNSELQSYTGDPANLRVSGGNLEIIATDRPAANMPYGSARIRTFGKQSFRYLHGGTLRIEASIQLPGGQGMWPAFWMLPEDSVYGIWPLSGEIDIVEAVNLGTGDPARTVTSGTVHYGMPWPFNERTGSETSNEMNPANAFNVYAIEWEAGEIRWYVNDEHRYTQTGEQWYTLSGRDGVTRVLKGGAPFDKPFHILLNIAVGGSLPSAPDSTTVFPQTMMVDYVRVINCGSDRSQSNCYKTTPEVRPGGSDTTGSSGVVHLLDVFTNGLQTYTQGDTTVSFASSTTAASGVTVNTDAAVGTDQTMEVSFTAPGSTVTLGAQMDNEEVAFNVNGATTISPTGRVPVQLEFDLAVIESAGAQSGLEVRIVDDGGNYLSQQYSASKLEEIKAAGSEGVRQALDLGQMTRSGGFDQGRVVGLFSLGSTGPFDASARTVVQVDDIRFRIPCPASLPGTGTCNRGLAGEKPPPGGTPAGASVTLDVTEDLTTYPNVQDIYVNGFAEDSGFSMTAVFQAAAEEIMLDDGHGMVIQCSTPESGHTGGICGLGTAQGTEADWSAFQVLEFDLRVLTPPVDATADMRFKYETGKKTGPAADVDVVLGSAATFGSAWRRVRIDITDEVWSDYGLDRAIRIFIFPTFSQAQGAVWQIDNIKLYRP